MMEETVEIQAEAAVWLKQDDLAHDVQVLGLAIGGEAHDLVFVAIVGEAKPLGEGGIEDAEGVGEVDAVFDVDFAFDARAPGGGGEVAHAVDGDVDGVLKWGAEVAGGEVGKVVLDVVNTSLHAFAGKGVGNGLFDGFGLATLLESLKDEFEAGAGTEDEEETAEVVDLGVEVDGDVFEVLETQAGFVQAVLHGEGGETGPVFDAAESLFFDCGDELAVANDGGGGVAMVGVDSEDGHGEWE